MPRTRAAATVEVEHRAAHGEIRAVSAEDHTFTLRVVTYGVEDSYGSVWAPGVFRDSLANKLPSAVWAHDWSRIIGRITSYSDSDVGLDATVQLANIDEVPDARMAWSLLRDGHVGDTSFGFARVDWQTYDQMDPADVVSPTHYETIRAARLDEVSVVLVGAVPGSKVTGVRDARITRTDAEALLRRVAAGDLDLRGAIEALNSEEPLAAPAPEPWALPERSLTAGLDLVRLDDRLPRGQEPATRAALDSFFLHGRRAAAIEWGAEGDLDRARALLASYVGPAHAAEYAAALRTLAVG